MTRVFAALVLVLTASVAFGYTGATVTVVDVQPSDVPGPQPIRVFPVPAAAGMAGAKLIYDNYAQLAFSSGFGTLAERNFVTLPMTAPGITINSVTYQGKWSAGGFKVLAINNAYAPQTGLYTNSEQVPTDNRFPAYIPRPGRYAGYDYTAVEFVLDSPAKEFGVYVAMNSNQWSPTWGTDDDNNNKTLTSRKLQVAVLSETDTFATAQYTEVAAGDMYAPFVKVVGNGTDKIKAVCVVQDSSVESGAPFGFFDAYVVPAVKPGDANGDGVVNIFDLLVLANAWNTVAGDPLFDAACDFTGDGAINIFDLLVLADNWNT